MNLKAFVASTYLDLSEHRQYVLNSLRAAGISVDPMEDWSADPDLPQRLSQNRVRGCDLCILLLAFRRGFIPKGKDKSITQFEYEYAMANGIDVLVFLLRDDTPWKREYDELATDQELQRWRNELRNNHVVSEFGLEPDSVEVLPAVMRWLSAREDSHRTIWPMAVDMDLVTQSFFESTFPAYILDDSRCVVSWNSSFMILVGQHDGPIRGQSLKHWLASKGHGMTITSTAKGSGHSIERATLVLHTERFGRVEFDQLTTPILDRESGRVKYFAAALSPSVTEREVVESFLEAVESRLADQLFWSQYAVAYDRVLMRYPGYTQLIEMHCDSVLKAPLGRVLDLGAGTGNVTLAILNRSADWRVIAVDYNQSMLYQLLRKCRKFENRMEIRFAEIEQLVDITPGSISAVVMNNVLMFLTEPLKVLQRVCAWLIAGGVLSLHVPNLDSSIETLLLDIRNKLEESGDFREVSEDYSLVYSQNLRMGAVHKKLSKFSANALTQLLEEAGFIVDLIKDGTYAGQGMYAVASKPKDSAPRAE
jgi:ubiquinone/menaquinone biosynthesis C-methylase UbiE